MLDQLGAFVPAPRIVGLLPTETPRLVRAMGRFDLTAAVVNGVVGAGIFGAPAAVAALVGPWGPLAALAAAAGILTVVLCFAEVGSRFDTSGGPLPLHARGVRPARRLRRGLAARLDAAALGGGDPQRVRRVPRRARALDRDGRRPRGGDDARRRARDRGQRARHPARRLDRRRLHARRSSSPSCCWSPLGCRR